MDPPTFRIEALVPVERCGPEIPAFGRIRPHHLPTWPRTKMARSAASPNHPRLPRPLGRTNSAASKGPSATPAFPPTWKSDCARPCCPPEARRATRDDSGWNTDEPIPIRATEAIRTGYVDTREKRTSPTRVEAIPAAREYGWGLRSVTKPTRG